MGAPEWSLCLVHPQGCDLRTKLCSAGSNPAEGGPGGSYLGLKRWATLSKFSFFFYPWLCLWLIFYALPSFSYALALPFAATFKISSFCDICLQSQSEPH